jgi:phosphate transport system ATP-binding protein
MDKPKIVSKDFNVYYGDEQALNGINLEVYPNEILGVIGPAGSGKTTFLRCLNRINDMIPNLRITGKLLLDGIDLYGENIHVPHLRRIMGMVFAVPTPLPGSIRHNLTLGLRFNGIGRGNLDEIIERALRSAYLWDEVKDRLEESVFNLSGGQQQRLCLARTLALDPEVILLDEPSSGLDPISTAKIEEALLELKVHHTLILVTNNVMQASRISDRSAFFFQGDLIEVGLTDQLFTKPKDEKTYDYISGRIG